MTTTPQAALLREAELALEYCIKALNSLGLSKSTREFAAANARQVLAKLQATQAEPVQAGELPPLPEPRPYGYIAQTEYLYTDKQMHAYARAALSARKPLTTLTRERMEAGRHQIFSTNNPLCPCDSKTFRKVAEWTEREFCRINGIGLEVKHG